MPGGAFTAAEGTQYVADDFFDSGRIADTSDAITATEDDILFQTERFGTFDYLIPVQNGTYAVTFGFAETYLNSVGARIFDVEIESQLVLENFDIFATAGGENIAISSGPFIVEVTDGLLEIDFIKGLQKQKINAISIVDVSEGGPGGNAARPVDDSTTTRGRRAHRHRPRRGAGQRQPPQRRRDDRHAVSGPSNGS